VHAVGAGRAARLVLLGETFTPEQAIEWGVEGEVAAPEQVLDAARALAARLAQGPTRAYAESKRLLAAAAAGATLPDVLRAEGEAQTRLGASEDHRNAVTAFLSRQRPEFAGR